MSQLNTLQEKLQPGKVYRRQELTKWSKSVDRHLQQLQKSGALKKLSPGLYYCPKKNVFGEVPADETTLIETFLKDCRFLLTSANAYNVLSVLVQHSYIMKQWFTTINGTENLSWEGGFLVFR